jgi:hypothetical protein
MEDDGHFAQDGGEALNLDDDFNDSEEASNDVPQQRVGGGRAAAPAGKVEGQKLDN